MRCWDLIVIGTGLAGLTAARTAVEMGAKVLIVGRGMGSLTLFGNTIDLLGEIPPGADMEAGVMSWIATHPDHPYVRTGWTGIAEALDAFREFFPPPYTFAPVGGGNSLVPTGAGTVRPTYLLPVTMTAGVGISAEDTLIVSFRGFKDFQGDTVSLHLQCRGVNLSLPRYGLEGVTALAFALMDEVFRKPGEAIRASWRGKTHRPPRLSPRNPARMATLEAVTGAKVFEIPMLPPSIPGVRIFRRLREDLIAKGATFLMGNPVIGAALKNGRCEGITLRNPPLTTEYRAERYVLATGRFLGGGLWADMERVSEPLFHLPVSQPATRGEWFRERFFQPEAHPIHRAGIVTDADLRPVDGGGKAVLSNLWVAGSILAHHEAIEEKSREGIDIATGFLAAKRALTS